MGSSSSKFRKYLQNGDEYAALQAFESSPELLNSLDPNSSYGDSLNHNTPLHLVAKHAMKPLLRIFLTELNGNPNKQNALEETPLHLVCRGDSTRNASIVERRAHCLNLILQWRSAEEKVDLSCVDSEGNTALHYAAASGFKNCVEILVSHGAPLFITNKSTETVCDLAEKNKHEDIAQFLEAKMLFYTDELDNILSSYEEISEEVENGLRAQDLQEAKDQLLVETSDMLHVPLFTAEVLLRNHEWSRQSLLDSWMKDPIACCKDAGVSPPSSAINFSTTRESLKMCCEQIQKEYQNESLNSPARTVVAKEEIMCEICLVCISSEDLIQIPCLHQFCKSCWTTYVTAKIVEGEAHHIFCPAFECPHSVPVDVIERLVSADMVKRYLQFDIKAFVESNPSMKWCPFPGCARAVKVPKFEKVSAEILALSFTTPPSVSHAVDCGNGHYFCWECLAEAHAPSGCEKWKEWHNKIAEIKPQELKNTYAESEAAENGLWMVTNSKPCPNCKCPIQKNEGCNHMKCSKCKYEYCWVCLESWKKHGPGTGGYFRCNRHDAAKRAEVKTESLINQAEEHNKHMQELKRFLQYYTRFKNHENSFKFEEPFLKSIQEKVSGLLAFIDPASLKDLSFLEEAINELLRARRILCGAYVYGFYLEDNGYNKTIFEYLQKDLEETTEKLAEAVARTYVQTPQSKIIQMTSQVKRKRLDLLTAVYKGLIPPETPPSMRKSRKRRLPGLMGMDSEEDRMISQAILQSLENIDPNDPWVIDENGKHTNVAAICDWPDYDSDDDESSNPFLSSVLGICSREGCTRPRAKNCRTGEMHEFCSLACKHWNDIKSSESKTAFAHVDPAMDILIALEMSKLQINSPNNENVESFQHDIESTNLCFGFTLENINSGSNEELLPKNNLETSNYNVESTSHKHQDDGLNQQNDNIDSSIQDTVQQNDTIDSSIHEMVQQNGDTDSSMHDIVQQDNNIDSSIQDTVQQNDNIDSSIHDMVQQNDNIDSSIHDMVQQNDNIDSSIQDTAQQNDNIDSSIHDMVQQNDNIDSSIHDIVLQNDNIDSSIHYTVQQNDNIERTIHDMVQQNDNIDSSTHDMVRQNDNVDPSIHDMVQQNDNVDSNKYEEQIDSMSLQIDDIDSNSLDQLCDRMGQQNDNIVSNKSEQDDDSSQQNNDTDYEKHVDQDPNACEQQDNIVSSPHEQLDNFFLDVSENDPNSVITSESTDFPFGFDNEKPDLNFYLKNCCVDIAKNINVNAGNNCSKTEKELFKVLQQNSDTNGSYETVAINEENA